MDSMGYEWCAGEAMVLESRFRPTLWDFVSCLMLTLH